jgi:hypothetical protein
VTEPAQTHLVRAMSPTLPRPFSLCHDSDTDRTLYDHRFSEVILLDHDARVDSAHRVATCPGMPCPCLYAIWAKASLGLERALELLVVWVLFAVIVGAAASGRGRSVAGWIVLSILISPLFALILLLVMPNLRDQRAREEAHRQQLQQLATIAAAPTVASQPVSRPPERRDDPMATLTTLADLRDRGLITVDEFAMKKVELLARV